MKRVVVAPELPKAIGPYSQAVVHGEFLFCSGQIPVDPATGDLVAGGITEQTEQVCQNIRLLLGACGLDFSHVVKSSVFLTNLADFAAMNAVYGKYFVEPFPARSTIQVAALPRAASVEIEVIAAGVKSA